MARVRSRIGVLWLLAAAGALGGGEPVCPAGMLDGLRRDFGAQAAEEAEALLSRRLESGDFAYVEGDWEAAARKSRESGRPVLLRSYALT